MRPSTDPCKSQFYKQNWSEHKEEKCITQIMYVVQVAIRKRVTWMSEPCKPSGLYPKHVSDCQGKPHDTAKVILGPMAEVHPLPQVKE